jgi:diguanylate cyclase (GGDEF)-like protein
MKPFNSIHFIDELAKITSNNNREILERSLLETLNKYHYAEEYRLYQVLTLKPELALGLLAHSTKSNIQISEQAKRQDLAENVQQCVLQAIQQCTVVTGSADESSQEMFSVYPAQDRSGEVFAVLIELSQTIQQDQQRLVHGFLRLYANYLRLLDQTQRDKLTGLLNRETLEDEIARIIILNQQNIPHGVENAANIEHDKRQSKEVFRYWLGVLDIDHFKKINDTYGHLYGDEILILVSRLMESSVRTYDLIFRYGGEEFIILLKAFDLEHAKMAFNRIRTEISHHNYAKVEQVTVSIGVIEITEQSGPAEAIAEADEALYYAKDHGRNQVCVYTELLEQGLIQMPEQNIESGGIDFF